MTRLGRASWLLEQFHHIDTDGFRNPANDIDARGNIRTFDRPDVAGTEAGPVGKILLRQLFFMT